MSRVVAIDSGGNEHYPFSDWDKEEIFNTEDCIGCANQNAFPILSPCINCIDGNPLKVTGKYYRKQITTNADRIRAMTDEQLADFFENLGDGSAICDVIKTCGVVWRECKTCNECILKWLKEEAPDEQ